MQPLYILLDFDGVLNITPTWRPVEQLDDDFMAFDVDCADNLNNIIQHIHANYNIYKTANIVLTTTHRIHYDSEKWSVLFANRGIEVTADKISKVNTAKSFSELGNRCEEVLAWIKSNPDERFIIIDDDKSLRNLPIEYKKRWVETSFLIGFNKEKMQQAIRILAIDNEK